MADGRSMRNKFVPRANDVHPPSASRRCQNRCSRILGLYHVTLPTTVAEAATATRRRLEQEPRHSECQLRHGHIAAGGVAEAR